MAVAESCSDSVSNSELNVVVQAVSERNRFSERGGVSVRELERQERQ